jgi:hypothetical protein
MAAAGARQHRIATFMGGGTALGMARRIVVISTRPSGGVAGVAE